MHPAFHEGPYIYASIVEGPLSVSGERIGIRNLITDEPAIDEVPFLDGTILKDHPSSARTLVVDELPFVGTPIHPGHQTVSVHIAIHEVSDIAVPFGCDQPALAAMLPIQEVTLIYGPVVIVESALAGNIVVQEIPLVELAIGPGYPPLSMHLAFHEISDVDMAHIGDQSALAMERTVDESALIGTSGVHGHLTDTMWFTVHYVAFVDISGRLGQPSLSVPDFIFGGPHIGISVGVGISSWHRRIKTWPSTDCSYETMRNMAFQKHPIRRVLP